jgi:chromosome partitioning protein
MADPVQVRGVDGEWSMLFSDRFMIRPWGAPAKKRKASDFTARAMAVIAVINSKGGAGKSTVTSHLAAYCAGRSPDVALCDLDPQRSTETWLKQRPANSAKIRGHGLANSFTRPPADARHVFIDTPSGFQGMSYLRVMMYADAVLVPTAFSFFDRQALESTVRMLQAAPRVVKGNCTIACVGMRIDSRSNDPALLETMLRDLGVPYLGAIPAARVYSRCLEQGLTVFDFPSAVARRQIEHWSGVIAWLETNLAKVAPRQVTPCVPSRRPAVPNVPAQAPVLEARRSLASTLIRHIPRFLVR